MIPGAPDGSSNSTTAPISPASRPGPNGPMPSNFSQTGIVPPEIAVHHIVASTMALIEWWLDHHMPYSPERMGAIYAELITRPAPTPS